MRVWDFLRLLKESYMDYLNLIRDLGYGKDATRRIEVTASWRNKYGLTPEERQKADDIAKTLKEYNEVVDQAAQLNMKAAVQTVANRCLPEAADNAH